MEHTMTVVTDPAVLSQYPGGPVLRCDVCGTMLRTGQPHTGVQPKPHQSLEALIVIEALEDGE